MPEKYWLSPLSAKNVNPNTPIGTKEVTGFAKGRVLDYGCGFGRLAPEFDDYVGVDLTEHRLAECRRQHPDKTFMLTTDLQSDAVFDTVILDNVLIHVPDDEIEDLLGDVTGFGERVIIAEHLGRHFRGRPLQWHRDLSEYEDIFECLGFTLMVTATVDNPNYRSAGKMSVMLWMPA